MPAKNGHSHQRRAEHGVVHGTAVYRKYGELLPSRKSGWPRISMAEASGVPISIFENK
jgi:hypothetical protein